MGKGNAPLHNAVFFLQELAPQVLEDLKGRYPELVDEMKPSELGGEGDEDELDKKRAEFHMENLNTARELTQQAVDEMALRIKSAKRYELAGKIVALLSTSGVLAGLAFGEKVTAVIGGSLGWLTSAGGLFANYKASTDVLKAYPEMYMGVQTAKERQNQLMLAMEYGDPTTLQIAIKDANEAAGALYRLLANMGSGFAHSGAKA